MIRETPLVSVTEIPTVSCAANWPPHRQATAVQNVRVLLAIKNLPRFLGSSAEAVKLEIEEK